MTPTSAPLRSRSRTSHSGSHAPARRLMLAEGLDAASAAFEVGYESASQFNREYSRFFGRSPMRDVKALRAPAR
ncbi:AraC-like DNA-binding protein [Duganella sp. 1411]|nr:AraC-like DNA-binding protein [Duganella sp. 1411]